MAYVLVWHDYDGYYEEDDFQNENELVHRLLEISRREYADEYGAEIISLTKGKVVDFEYQRDGKSEKLIISGKVKFEIAIMDAKIPEPDMRCPVCGDDAVLIDKNVSVKSEGEYYGRNLYGCPECGREFCT